MVGIKDIGSIAISLGKSTLYGGFKGAICGVLYGKIFNYPMKECSKIMAISQALNGLFMKFICSSMSTDMIERKNIGIVSILQIIFSTINFIQLKVVYERGLIGRKGLQVLCGILIIEAINCQARHIINWHRFKKAAENNKLTLE